MDKKNHLLVTTGKKIGQDTESIHVDRPDESAGFAVEGHVKIFDPGSKEIYVEKRA